MRRVFLACALTGMVTSLVVGGVAWALQSPVDGNGVIHACYNSSTGAMSLDTKGTCPARGKTTPITWNATGPKGDPGPSGVPLCGGYPHNAIDWSIPGSTPGHGCDLNGANLTDAVLTNANLVNANIAHANLVGANFSGANLTGANLNAVTAEDSNNIVRFDGAVLDDANLDHADISVAVIRNAHLVNANLTSAHLVQDHLDGSDLSGADFTNAILFHTVGMDTATVTGAVWQNTLCPDNTNSDNNGGTCVGHFTNF